LDQLQIDMFENETHLLTIKNYLLLKIHFLKNNLYSKTVNKENIMYIQTIRKCKHKAYLQNDIIPFNPIFGKHKLYMNFIIYIIIMKISWSNSHSSMFVKEIIKGQKHFKKVFSYLLAHVLILAYDQQRNNIAAKHDK
jgi:hypothetical protein